MNIILTKTYNKGYNNSRIEIYSGGYLMNNKNYYKDENIERTEFLLRKICFNIKKKGREILDDFDITPPQFDALQCIINCGEITIGELSNKLFLAPSTITDLIDRMEKTGLVQRVRDTKDRRVVKVEGLEKGYSLIEQVLIKRCGFIDDCMTEATKDEKVDFINHLESLYNSSPFSSNND